MALLLVATTTYRPDRTTAYLTSSLVGQGSVFTAGKIELSGVPVSALLEFSGAHPDAAPKYGNLTIANSGNASLRYAISDMATCSGGPPCPLASALMLDIAVKGTADTGTCAGTATDFANLTAIYGSTAPGGGSSPLADSTGAKLNLVGDVSAGSSHSGNRLLEPGSSELLCFRVFLPPTAPASLQSTHVTVTFTFEAVQAAGT